jgi:hypothetical protein
LEIKNKMVIIKEVSENEFISEFKGSQYKNNYTTKGLRALYSHLYDLSDDLVGDFHFDLVAIACDYDEYENIEEYLRNYNSNIERKDYENYLDYKHEVLEEIEANTTLIKIDDNSFIVQLY